MKFKSSTMKCEAGDIAVVISNRFSGNIGTFVQVIEAVNFPGFGVLWKFKNASRPLLLGTYDDPFAFVQVTATTEENQALLRDEDLHPIPGLKKETAIKTTISV